MTAIFGSHLSICCKDSAKPCTYIQGIVGVAHLIFTGSGGYVLGYGDKGGPSRAEDKPLHHRDVTSNMGNELMDIGEPEGDQEVMERSDDSGSDSDEDDPGNRNLPLIPPMPGNIGLPHGFGRRGRPPWGPRQFPGLGGDDDDDDEMFEGEGHRLGGKEAPPTVGDLQMPQLKMRASGNIVHLPPWQIMYLRNGIVFLDKSSAVKHQKQSLSAIGSVPNKVQFLSTLTITCMVCVHMYE